MPNNTYVGSCLCQKVTYEVVGDFEKFYLCHCSRCRKETGSAHAANLFSRSAAFRWTSGESRVKKYALPQTRFAKSFCEDCGSALPTVREDHSIVVPAGSLDSAIDFIPQGHIHLGSKANWEKDFDKIPRFDALPS